MKIQESSENYLETILILKNKNGHVRSIDIANELSFSKPSVSHAMKQLREHGYIVLDPSNHIHLTDLGLEIANRIIQRHELLTAYLMILGVSEQTAKEDACRMEHIISEESFQQLQKHYQEKLK